MRRLCSIPPCDFNSRPSARGDDGQRSISAGRDISIHAPPRGATRKRGRPRKNPPNFNSRPSARGDTNRSRLVMPAPISIHAPPRGATRKKWYRDATRTISIHAPPRGATRLRASRETAKNISIHAPPRGATCPDSHGGIGRGRYFNSRPSARGDSRIG